MTPAWPQRSPPRAGRRSTPKLTESAIQIAVMHHLTLRGKPDVLAWHVPNGGSRSKAEAGRFKAEGVVPGIPDICILFRGQFFGLELKAERGRVSPAQRVMADRLAAAGGTVAVAVGLDAAIAQLEAWGILR
jgi:hypothetical protein